MILKRASKTPNRNDRRKTEQEKRFPNYYIFKKKPEMNEQKSKVKR